MTETEYVPETGSAVVFYHGQMHDGEPLTDDAPAKWIFRFDILYAREGVEVDETADGGKVDGTQMYLAIEEFVEEVDQDTVAAFAFMGA